MQSPLDDLAKILDMPPRMAYWLQRALCYTPNFKKSEMACDWQEGRPPEHVFCEVWIYDHVIPGVSEGWQFYSMQSGIHPLTNRLHHSDNIKAWRIPDTEPA